MEIGTKGSGLQGPDEELPLRLLRGRGGHKERPDEGHIATGHQDARCGRLLLCPLRRILRQVETSCALADAKDTQIGQPQTSAACHGSTSYEQEPRTPSTAEAFASSGCRRLGALAWRVV